MKRRLIKASALSTALIIAVSSVPAAAQLKDKPVGAPMTAWEDTNSGRNLTDVPWTAVTPKGTHEVVEDTAAAQTSLQPATRESTLPRAALKETAAQVNAMLAKPEVEGKVEFNYKGISDGGKPEYELKATVLFPDRKDEIDGDDLPEREVSFVREQAGVPVDGVTTPKINGLKRPDESIEVFAYPEEDSGKQLPADLPKDVTGDLITFETSDVLLEGETIFSARVQLADSDAAPGAWTLYTGEVSAYTLNASDNRVPQVRAFSAQASRGAVPSNSARVVVQVGGDRLLAGSNNATKDPKDPNDPRKIRNRLDSVYRYSAGVGAKLKLHTMNSGGKLTLINESWAQCTSDINGECFFDIPLGSISTSQRYWIAMTEASPGFEIQEMVRTGGSGNEGTSSGELLRYSYQIPLQLKAGSTYYSGVSYESAPTFMYEVKSRQVVSTIKINGIDKEDPNGIPRYNYSSLGVFQQVRSNPPLSNRCGLRVGFIVDTSGSMGSQGIGTIKTILNGGVIGDKSVDGVIDSLATTKTEMGFVSFDASSPGTGQKENILKPLDISSERERGAARAWVGGLQPPKGGTNWEDALWQYVNHNNELPEKTYDVVYMITDGNPTRLIKKSTDTGNGFEGEFRQVEAAMGMANTLKSQGTRVVSVGVPANWPSRTASAGDSQLSVSEHNLHALSGANPKDTETTLRKQNFATYTNADVFRQALINTHNTCAITVERRFYEGDKEDVVPSPGNTRATKEESEEWGFEGVLTPTTGRVEKNERPVADSRSDNLVATFSLDGKNKYKSVEVREPAGDIPDGWVRMDAGGGDNAQCSGPGDTSVPVNNLDPPGADNLTNDFELRDVPREGGIHCIVYYRKRLEPAGFDLTVQKVDADDNTVFLDGAQFELRWLDAAEGEDPRVDQSTGTPAAVGQFMWKALKAGRYLLAETKAPDDGYSLLPQPVFFRVDRDRDKLVLLLLSGPDDKEGTKVRTDQLSFPIVGFEAADNDVNMKLANVRVGDLPMTGGVGVMPWMFAGLLITVVGALAGSGGFRGRRV